MQFAREPDLGAHDAVVGEIGDHLACDPFDRAGGLHYGECVLERGQVLHQVPGLGTAGEPRP